MRYLRRAHDGARTEALEGDFQEGDTVRVDAKDGELVFERAGVAETAAA
jgi:hypothetical protein